MKNLFDYSRKASIACSEEYAGSLVLYLLDLSECKYKFLPDINKITTLEMHRHLKKCKICYNGLNYVKSDLASVEGGSELFSVEHFKLLKKNEKYLDDLVKEK